MACLCLQNTHEVDFGSNAGCDDRRRTSAKALLIFSTPAAVHPPLCTSCSSMIYRALPILSFKVVLKKR